MKPCPFGGGASCCPCRPCCPHLDITSFVHHSPLTPSVHHLPLTPYPLPHRLAPARGNCGSSAYVDQRSMSAQLRHHQVIISHQFIAYPLPLTPYPTNEEEGRSGIGQPRIVVVCRCTVITRAAPTSSGHHQPSVHHPSSSSLPLTPRIKKKAAPLGR